MSLLNQVLQDLDGRDQPRTRQPVRLAAAPQVAGYADDPDDTEGRNWVRIGTWSTVGIAMVLAAWLFHDPERGARVTQAPVAPAPEVAVAAVKPLPPDSRENVQPTPDPAAEPPVGLAEEPAPVREIPTMAGAPVAAVPAAPVSSTATVDDIASGTPSRTAEPDEDHYLALRNTELPMETDRRPAKAGRKVPSSVSVKTSNASSPQPLEQIREAIGDGELAKAEHLLEQRLRVAPKDIEARELLIGLMLRGERYDSARRQLDLALSQRPGHSPFVLIKSRMLVQDGEIDEAIRMLEGAPGETHGRAERLQMLGVLYQQQSRYEDALQSYRALLSLAPDAGPVWVGLAISLDGLGDAEALGAYRRALQLGGLPAAAGQYARQRVGELERSGG